MSKTPIYMIWAGMIDRCCNPNSPVYQYYGGRGIALCAAWRNSFPTFLADMGDRPSTAFSLERIDNDDGYHPGNVKWGTDAEQVRNTRRNVRITIDGETHIVHDWMRILSVPKSVYYRRLKAGMTPEQAMKAPRLPAKRLITFGGKTQSLAGWSRATGLTRECIAGRLNAGMPEADALTLPSGLDTRLITFKGETHSIAEWGRITKLGDLVSSRLCQGMPIHRALTQPIGPQGRRARKR